MKDTDPTSAPAGWAVAAIGPTGSAATVTVHDLSIPAEDADDPMVILNPEIHATIQFPGAAPFSCRYVGDDVREVNDTAPATGLDLEDVLDEAAPEGTDPDQVAAVFGLLLGLNTGARAVMVAALGGPVTDPIRHAIQHATDASSDTFQVHPAT